MAEDLWSVGAESVGVGGAEKSGDLWSIAAKEVGVSDQPNDYQSRRKKYHEAMRTDPTFRAKPAEERAKMLFPDALEQDRPVVTPKPSRGIIGSAQEEAGAGARMAAEGWDELIRPKSYARTLMGAPIANIVGGTAQQIAAPVVGPFNELVSRPLGNLARRAPVPDPETLGQQVEIAGDVAGPPVASKVAGMLKAPLARALPTIKEQVGKLTAQKNARLAGNEVSRETRLSELDELTGKAQIADVQNQAPRFSRLPAERTAIRERAASDIADTQARLTAQQRVVGQEAASAAAPAGPKRANFEKRYTDIERVGDRTFTQPLNLNAASQGVVRERGLPGAPTTQAERTGSGFVQTLSEGGSAPQIEEEIQNTVRRMITEGVDAKKIDYNEVTKAVLGNATADSVSVGELLRTRKRLRAAQRAAYDADHKNLARQFGVMEDAITEDIKKGNPKLAKLAAKLDQDYFRKKSVDWYAQGVDQAFDPATGAWDRKRFTKWWEKHADSTNNDKDLRRLLGNRYDGTKGLIEDMQRATELNIEKAAQESARNIRRRMGGELREVAGREKELGKLEKGTEAQILKAGEKQRGIIEAESTAKAKAIESEMKKKIEEITGRPYEGEFSKVFGSIALVTGAGTAGAGMLTGNPTLMTTGLMTAGGGAITVLTHDALIKLINMPHGLSLVRRAVRAVPGTAEAVSAAAGLANAAKQFQSSAPEESQEKPKAPAKPASNKDALLKKYNIK